MMHGTRRDELPRPIYGFAAIRAHGRGDGATSRPRRRVDIEGCEPDAQEGVGSRCVGGRHWRLVGHALKVPHQERQPIYLHRTVHQAKGLAYRAMRRHPSTTLDDSVLADRIRSTIGPLEKQIHNSRINVTVENGIAILHGDIESREAATQIEEAVRGVTGVRDIRSHLSH